MSRKVFISALGFSNYAECRYVIEDFTSDSTKFIQEATLSYLDAYTWAPDDIALILLTKGAEEANWKDRSDDEGLESRLGRMNLPIQVKALRDLPNGYNELELWQIFGLIFNELKDNDELYIDLTHGFRYIPMLVMVLVNYSKFLKNVKVKSITYGNWESRNKEKNEAPITSLTSLTLLQDWTYAAGQFIEFGNPEKLVDLSRDNIRPILKSSKGKDKEAKTLQHLANSLVDSVDDIKLCRLLNIIDFKSLESLNNNISSVGSSYIVPLNPLLNKIKDSFSQFSTQKRCAKNGFIAAKWCADNGLYQQAITLAQESIITILCEQYNLDTVSIVDRHFVSTVLNSPILGDELRLCEEKKPLFNRIKGSEDFDTLSVVYRECSTLRNDYNHAGMRENPTNSNRLKSKINNTVLKIMDHFENREEISKEDILLNLSNHPYSMWNNKQKEAAAEYGKVEDITFPNVSEQGDDTYIRDLAEKYVGIISGYMDKYNVTVHIMGELTFSFSLIKKLQELGCICIASTSERVVEESNGKKTVYFNFEKFRKYS